LKFCSDIFQGKAAENGVEKKASDSEVVKISVIGLVQAIVGRKPWFFLIKSRGFKHKYALLDN
jgi:hypothetical protein